ncbi:4-hydroxy-tetrahydrodipicolinate reductase [Dehalococcoides mccartyi]|jgi:4-hydroxy-tetrahydrodipicolinate reductase|uniref:4-hydroxy-tetrahydrodipicolinate reductase n=1 Tax=Dehalococcoides mccartyi TaxID=61435 RepID=UPI0004E09F11|nr:4-hydroxy-tetrahydrodipicolinate reductase [Dehalococcoides mccartyi]AII58016.1 dihydrodipicolinate reductase [Dehalococcoides mccartyi CG1]APH12529.1 4-hydroxy-tetrahydrodipicolinate reductase [Dehalococcoides mccartyi]
MTPIKVVVHGASGKMGQEVLKTLCQENNLLPVGAVDIRAESPSLTLPDGSGSIPYSADLSFILSQTKPDVMVDFTIAKASMPAIRIAAAHKVNLVIGTTGFSPEEISEIELLAKTNDIGIIVAPNFALGAIIMVHLAQVASRFLSSAEVIELHHDKKLDSPSGTALATITAMLRARGEAFNKPTKENLTDARGQEHDGIRVHSVRLPGLLAHQEVIFGAAGQTLTIRHDAFSRECYMPGVTLAIKEIVQTKGFVFGLDKLLKL